MPEKDVNIQLDRYAPASELIESWLGRFHAPQSKSRFSISPWLSFLVGLFSGLACFLAAMMIDNSGNEPTTSSDFQPQVAPRQLEAAQPPDLTQLPSKPPLSLRANLVPRPEGTGANPSIAGDTDEPELPSVENLEAMPGVDESEPTLAPVTRDPWEQAAGLLQFRGVPTHTWYGEGPLPAKPRVLWRFPKQPMCATTAVGKEATTWCGTGWTGQPALWEHDSGQLEVIFGAYDRAVHFLDAETGKRTRPDFVTGDIIKGSVTIDPDGFPLIYFGSRDNKLRIVALDRDKPLELWSLDAYAVPSFWNDDWDGNPSVVDGFLLEGGENSYFFAVELNRTYDVDGLVHVAPQIRLAYPGWNKEELRAIGDQNVSIENSVAVFKDRVYFANSGGRVVGLDLNLAKQGEALVVFDFWAGDDVDASIVIDGEGMLYVAVELERFLPRADLLGQLLKLNPYRPEDPVVWGIKVPAAGKDHKGGIWATPALVGDLLYVTTHSGKLFAVDRHAGQIVFNDDVGWHAWSSPVVVGDQLLVATCSGELRAYSIANPQTPAPIWSMNISSGACIESTPAVWKGHIFVGARDGYFYAFGD